MSLSSSNLDAFSAVSRLKSFSAAAKQLNVTQSALSQRVLNLEREIGSTLFIREPSGIRMTDLGERLLRYCQSKEVLETEFMSGLGATNKEELSGVVRIAGFSSVTRSIVMPAVADLINKHPRLQIELRNAELRELPSLLTTGAANFILNTQAIDKQGVESQPIGFEENVLVQSSSKSSRRDVYLDHDGEDTTTYDFFKHQGRKTPSLTRNYLGEIYSIIEGVKLGLGRAVVPLHLAEDVKGLERVAGFKTMKTPVYLSYYAQAFYTDLHQAIVSCLTNNAPDYLAKR